MPIMFLATNILEKLRRINVYALDQVQLGIISKNDMKFNFAEQCLNDVLAKGILRFYSKFDFDNLLFDETRPKNHHCQRFRRKVIWQTNQRHFRGDGFKLLPMVLLSFE